MIIALITDFGMTDWFTGEMKGIMYGISPSAHIVDISNNVPNGDIRSAAFTLMASYASFPEKTVFCVPIDPDISGDCSAIAVQTDRYTFVGPDNGVLSWALNKEKIICTVALKNAHFFRNPSSQTFRGRDIFGPVAAYLSIGVLIEAMGPAVECYCQLPFPEPEIDKVIKAEILYTDRFGNCITNIENKKFDRKDKYELFIDGQKITAPLVSSYDKVNQGDVMIYAGSAGYVEIGISHGSAGKELSLKTGCKIRLK